jgi:hypothetical protein
LWENQHAKQKKNRDTREGGKILLELGVHRCFSNATFRPRRLSTGCEPPQGGSGEREMIIVVQMASFGGVGGGLLRCRRIYAEGGCGGGETGVTHAAWRVRMAD